MQKLTKEQLNRLTAAQAAGEPVPVDIRELVMANYEFDGSESEEIIAEAARNLGTTIHDIFRETIARHGMNPNVVFDDEEDTIKLHLTEERKPRFVEAAKAGKPMPDDIARSFMKQLFLGRIMTASDKAKQWMAENQKAFECWNRFVEQHGLPLARFNNLGRAPERDAGKQWPEENSEAIESSNDYVEKHGLPLEKYRSF